jgi:hypothetical protein
MSHNFIERDAMSGVDQEILDRIRLVNWQPNSEFNIHSAVPQMIKIKADASGPKSPVPISAYTTGSNIVSFTSSNIYDLKVGDLLSFSAEAHVYLRQSSQSGDQASYYVESVAPGAGTSGTFTTKLPYGLIMPAGGSSACSATPITRGDTLGVTTDCADWTVKSPTLRYWIDDHSQNLFVGCKRVMMFQKGSNLPEQVYWSGLFPFDNLASIQMFHGQRVVRGQRVRRLSGARAAAGAVLPFVVHGDGTTTSFGTPSTAALDTADGEWLEATALIEANAVAIAMGVELTGAAGDIFIIAQPMNAFGSAIGDGAYVPFNGRVEPRVNFAPRTYFGASFTMPTVSDDPALLDDDVYYSFEFNLYSESNGVFFDVKTMMAAFECKSTAAGVPIAWRNLRYPPLRFGFNVHTQVANQVISSGGPVEVPLENGRGFIYTTTSGATINSASIEISSLWVGRYR